MHELFAGVLDGSARGTRFADALGWPDDLRRHAQVLAVAYETSRPAVDQWIGAAPSPPPATARRRAMHQPGVTTRAAPARAGSTQPLMQREGVHRDGASLAAALLLAAGIVAVAAAVSA